MTLGLHQLQAAVDHLCQRDLHLRQQSHVHATGSQACVLRDESAVPTHELHESNAVLVASRLYICGINGLPGFSARGVKAEGPVKQRNVVVDSLGNCNDGALIALGLHHLVHVVCAKVRAIAADDEVRADAHADQMLRLLILRWIPAVAHEDRAAQVVDALHDLRRQLQPVGRVHDALVAALDAPDLLHSVHVEHHHELAHDRVQARAEAAAGDDRRHDALGVKVQQGGGPSTEHVVVRMPPARQRHRCGHVACLLKGGDPLLQRGL
mmetsp:Transcript_59548/g.169358  ORF Transcript_59548/g.169358 Transcript_59548/m.169358 type:complete len:267 (-) Transcript_59548:692-1492(-)